jgi:hypothetical protein
MTMSRVNNRDRLTSERKIVSGSEVLRLSQNNESTMKHKASKRARAVVASWNGVF